MPGVKDYRTVEIAGIVEHHIPKLLLQWNYGTAKGDYNDKRTRQYIFTYQNYSKMFLTLSAQMTTVTP